MIILEGFNLARTRVVTVLTLKLSHWRVPPYIVYGMGHHSPDKAFDSYCKAIASSHGHPLLGRLRSPEFGADRRYYEDCLGHLPLRAGPGNALCVRSFIG